MPRLALLADIHGNLQALEAVQRDLEQQGADRVVVLGDTVGYGPNPRECLERAADIAEVILLGNHEADLIRLDPDMDVEKELRDWTGAQLAGLPAWDALVRRAAAIGIEEAASHVEDGIQLVHGSPDAPVTQYIWPAHSCQYLVFNHQIGLRLSGFLDEFEQPIGFCGHTHTPAVLTEYAHHGMFDPYESHLEWNRNKSFLSPEALFVVPLGSVGLRIPDGARLVINPGSVGQPRDGDTAASYAIFDGCSVAFRRVPYDSTPTLSSLAALPIDEELRQDLITRLTRGE
jgi:predicted phosphodiesterase